MREKLKHIFLVLTPFEKRRFWIQVALDIFISIADIGMLAFLLVVVNFYINKSNHGAINFLPSWILDTNSIALITVFFVLFGIKNLLAMIISNAQYRFMGEVAIRISKQKLHNYQHAGYFDFVNTDSAEHIRKIAFQPLEFSQHILSGMQQIIIQSVLVLLTITAILLYNPQIFLLLLLILLPPIALVFFYIKRRLAAVRKNILSNNERSFQYLLDALKGYVEGNIYQRNYFFYNRFGVARKLFNEYFFKSLSVQAMPSRIIEIFATLGLFILIVIAQWLGIKDNSSLITIGAFMAASYKIIPGIVKIMNTAAQMKIHETSISVMEAFRKEPGGQLGVANEPIQNITLSNLGFKYGGQEVLTDFSMTINRGDFIAITGRSGKGKTTVFNLLLGFLIPSSGNISINGSPVSSKQIEAYWPQVSYVRQQTFLIHDTILRNIVLDEKGVDEKVLESALKVSGVADIVSQSPDGLHKIITENGKNISGGQQQRIAIARALYKNAELFLLDEPFNELDKPSAILLLQHLKNISSKGKIVIMITHDKECLSYCNKIISLDEQ